ncbi:MAG: DUF349 domain-containing protein [Schleiferiaceae bacterium]|nr:DUF349 domain-containing protein [Schleiferiaceae bacterium]
MAEKDLLPLDGNTNEEAANEAVQSAQEATQTPDLEAENSLSSPAEEAEVAIQALPETSLEVSPETALEELVEETESPLGASELSSPETPAATENPESTEKASEDTEDESDDANDEEKEEHEDHTADYGEKETSDLLEEAKRVLRDVAIEQARVPMLAIKDVLMVRWEEERSGALERFIEEGGNAIDFHFEQPTREAFYQTFNEFKKRRSAWKDEQVSLMSVNLDIKKALLDEIKKLAESDDLPTGQTYNEFKRINDRWKNVGHVPKDETRDLYASYRFFVDRFYDNLRLSQDLRDLDYKHNKEIKEGLIAEIKSISDKEWSASIGKDLQRLHASWKEVGPVAMEDKDLLWDQFREASNILHEKRRAKQDVAKAANDERLQQKEVLVAELEALAAEGSGEHGNWQKMTQKAKELREAMAKVGRTFGGSSDVLWDRFKKAEKAFFKERNSFYKSRKNIIKQALEAKYALVEQAEAMVGRTDWAEASKDLKRLQAEWKTTGFVPRKDSDKAWNKFRAACNTFFDALRNEQGDQRAVQKADRQKYEKSMNSRQSVEVARKELSQLENNMGFFTYADPKSPIVQDAMKKVEAARKNLEKAEAAQDKIRRDQRAEAKKAEAAAAQADEAASEASESPEE